MSELSKELEMLSSERKASTMAVNGQRDYYADMIRNGLGKQMDEALNGNIKLKLSLKERLRLWTKKYL